MTDGWIAVKHNVSRVIYLWCELKKALPGVRSRVRRSLANDI